MRRVTGDEMAAIDRYCIRGLEIPGILLMENAALKLLKNIDIVMNTDIAIVCGTGNNGADGLALARHLINLDHNVKIYIIGEINRENADYMTYYNILLNLGVRFETIHTIEDLENFEATISKMDLVVDAIFGTGLTAQVRGIQEYVIDMMNHCGVDILSVDIPSGLDANTGKIMGICVNPKKVVTFQLMKEGIAKNPLICNDVVVESISIPKKAIDRILGKQVIF
ncbi:NAD(P)H-hydrate epimerase [Microaceticoccus formicicus]|uniref:NAD(P)H-hydrate epimerase n=1 Tax=Microaceticoccus formicicus TaxID=3118105 RepID=UPI003CD020BD|nr:NAD(P)H-hydrate epimerase [Peptoniphilaceae bacterium AMB_02]